MLSYGRQSISEADIQNVVRVLNSDFLTCGPEVEAFEREFAEMTGAQHAVAVCNATAALHLAMRILGIGAGDRVVTSPNTFVASANAAIYAGATPDFSDIDEVSLNLSASALKEGWKSDTKAIVAVDYAGLPCDMPELARIARDGGAYVIEDSCHGTGGGFVADQKEWRLGGHPWADITTFSFHPVKTMTTGEGGILVTDNAEWAREARLLRSHGITREASSFVGLTDCSSTDAEIDLAERGPWYYEMQELGFNYRITDLQCALGRSQLARLPEFVQRRRQIVAQYNDAFTDLEWIATPSPKPWSGDLVSWHLYTVQIDFKKLGKTRSEVMEALKERGVGTQVLYIPVHLQPFYRNTYGYGPGKCPVAEEFYLRALSIPLFPDMSDEDVSHVIACVFDLT